MTTEGAVRPDDDDYDLLTFGEAGARLTVEIEQETRRLEQLEERLNYVGEDSELATQIAAVQERIEGLQDAQTRLAQPTGDRIAAAIAESSRQLEALEERMFYVNDDELATAIAAIEERIDALHAAGDRFAGGADERDAELERSRRQLEALEERLFYIAEDDQLPARIAATQRRIEELQRGREAG
jgi:chromosome segregation ATPase